MLIIEQLASVLQTPVAGADAVNAFAYLSQVGISLQKDGTLALGQTAFNKALRSNPAAVSNLFGNNQNIGFANRFDQLINNLLGPSGLIEVKQTDLQQSVRSETDHQTQIQTNLESLRSSYVQQYSALNAALAQMQQASNNLVGLL